MTRFRVTAFILAASLVMPLVAGAQLKIVPREKLENVVSPRLSPDSAILDFDRRAVNAAPMNEDDLPVSYRYTFRNVGDSPVMIRMVRTTCSCLTASCSSGKIKPGETADIIARYDPKGHPGRFERRIFVYTEDYADPAAVLSLNVNVSSGEDLSDEYPVQMGHIRMRRNALSFKQGIKSVEKIRFVNLSEKPLRLECEGQFLPESICFSTRPEIVEAGEEGEIVITYDPEAGETRSRVPVIIRNLGVSPGQATINVSIE